MFSYNNPTIEIKIKFCTLLFVPQLAFVDLCACLDFYIVVFISSFSVVYCIDKGSPDSDCTSNPHCSNISTIFIPLVQKWLRYFAHRDVFVICVTGRYLFIWTAVSREDVSTIHSHFTPLSFCSWLWTMKHVTDKNKQQHFIGFLSEAWRHRIQLSKHDCVMPEWCCLDFWQQDWTINCLHFTIHLFSCKTCLKILLKQST